jgi:hypothetical protein
MSEVSTLSIRTLKAVPHSLAIRCNLHQPQLVRARRKSSLGLKIEVDYAVPLQNTRLHSVENCC